MLELPAEPAVVLEAGQVAAEVRTLQRYKVLFKIKKGQRTNCPLKI